MRKALIYNPYFDTLGGGERYALEVARGLSSDHKVTIGWRDKGLLAKAKERFGMEIGNTVIDPEAYTSIQSGSLYAKYNLMKDYEVVFFVSDGSLPFLFGRRNLLHFQVPFYRHHKTIVDDIKIRLYHQIVVNSVFTKTVIEKSYGTDRTTVLYPPVTQIKPGKKQKLILNVGRFGSPTHPKKQEVILRAYLSLPKSVRKEWELVLAGGYKGEEEYLAKLRKMAGKERVLIVTNPDFVALKKLYAQASFYWHAAGFGEPDSAPERMEHFGITTVEAMSAGCVPLVIGKGGQPEIVGPEEGVIWYRVEELVEATVRIIRSPDTWRRMSERARIRAKNFDVDSFLRTLRSLV